MADWDNGYGKGDGQSVADELIDLRARLAAAEKQRDEALRQVPHIDTVMMLDAAKVKLSDAERDRDRLASERNLESLARNRATRDRDEALVRLRHAEADAEQAVAVTTIERDEARLLLQSMKEERAAVVAALGGYHHTRMSLIQELESLANARVERDTALAHAKAMYLAWQKGSPSSLEAACLAFLKDFPLI